jgi:hypothetical protein
MSIKNDFTVVGKDIRANKDSAIYPVLALHRYLGELADDNGFISSPSVRREDNFICLFGDYNIDEATAQKLCAGTITQEGGNTTFNRHSAEETRLLEELQRLLAPHKIGSVRLPPVTVHQYLTN